MEQRHITYSLLESGYKKDFQQSELVEVAHNTGLHEDLTTPCDFFVGWANEEVQTRKLKTLLITMI